MDLGHQLRPQQAMHMALSGHPAHVGKTVPIDDQGKMALTGSIMAGMAGMKMRFVFDHIIRTRKLRQAFMDLLFHQPHGPTPITK